MSDLDQQSSGAIIKNMTIYIILILFALTGVFIITIFLTCKYKKSCRKKSICKISEKTHRINFEKKELQKKQQRGFKCSSYHNNKHYHHHQRPPSPELMTQTTVAIGADRMKQNQQQTASFSVSWKLEMVKIYIDNIMCLYVEKSEEINRKFLKDC